MFSFFPLLNIKAPKRYIQFNYNTWYNNWVALTRKYTFFPAEISNFSGSRFPLCSVGHLQSYYHSLVMWLDTSQAFPSMIGGEGRLSLISFCKVVFSDKNTFLRYIPISNMFIKIPRMGKKIFSHWVVQLYNYEIKTTTHVSIHVHNFSFQKRESIILYIFFNPIKYFYSLLISWLVQRHKNHVIYVSD